MKRTKKQKMLMIIALIVSIAGLSIGFAAFSSTLTISSSATVSPDPSGFKLKMYGFNGETAGDLYNLSKYNGESSSNIFKLDEDSENLDFVLDNKSAVINNSSLSLDLGEVELIGPGLRVTMVKIVNEGNYDAYLDTSTLSYVITGNCVAASGTSESLVAEACSNISVEITLESYDTFLLGKEANDENISWDEYYEAQEQDCFVSHSGVCKLEKGDSIIGEIGLLYMPDENTGAIARADGPFTVTFPEIKLEFTSNDPSAVTE